ncbi:endonuclease 8-like 3 isoform X1 [Amblyraja radiata]|uniref:endonuclease 8-like 3 isoform X1 n=1 Tax=Amblyraja radiata TaxID=386614 RepID=UPI0014032381|nr:endonuclease 8-like 3 isoform X1 [Amblyraja radiata]
MVEGPGCALNGERLRGRVRTGQRVRAITRPNGQSGADHNAIQMLEGKVYTSVKTLGKELFMYFGQTALRIHFGMNGSMQINSSERKRSSGVAGSLQIQLTNDLICFFESTFNIRSTSECEEKVKLMEELDVCSAKFSHPRAEEEVKRHGAHMLCDVLLDQSVLPGVGNIIKNEAMFDSYLHPAVKICQLSTEQIHHLIRMTRDFTILFYKCQKIGSALYKHFRVYKRSTCRQCRGKIIVCRLGENNRMTYFCSHCQKENPSQVNISNFPQGNSLVTWAQNSPGQSTDTIAKQEEEEWTCQLCTLINAPAAKSCDACLTQRPAKTASPQKFGFDTNLIKYQCNNFGKPLVELKLNRRAAFGVTTLVLTSLRSSQKSPASCSSAGNEVKGNTLSPDGNPTFLAVVENCSANTLNSNHQIKSSCNKFANQATGNSTSSSYTDRSFCQPPKRMKKDHHFSTNSAVSDFRHADKSKCLKLNLRGSDNVNEGKGPAASPETPHCKKHSRPCELRVVRKEGDNKGRQFYTCSLPRDHQCDYFQWADLHFPICNHGTRCIMRTVLKLGPNNGRNFYVCSRGMNKQCDFFLWAENGPGFKIPAGC